MNQNTSSTRDGTTPLDDSFERYLQDKGKGRGGDGGNYRRNAGRELERFAEWAAGDRGADDWTGIVPDDVDREPIFDDLGERVFREYARHLGGDRGLKQNTVQTYYRYISAWCGWCVNEGYLEVLVRAFGYTVAARYLDNSEEMIRARYSHIEAGELGDVATEALETVDM